MSPTLFNAVLEDIFRNCKSRWNRTACGVDVGADIKLTNLRFADDVLIIASSLEEVRTMLDDLVTEAGKKGLSIHPGKTKIMSNRAGIYHRRGIKDIAVAGGRVAILGESESQKYLGRSLSFAKTMDIELDSRIKLGWKKFFAMKRVLCNRAYPLRQRVKLFNTCVTPTVLYGSVAWTLTQEQ
eukprot:4269341-Karenia_brevis.AAC.1